MAAAAVAAIGMTPNMTLDFVPGHEIHGCGVVSVGEDVVAAVAAAAANKWVRVPVHPAGEVRHGKPCVGHERGFR